MDLSKFLGTVITATVSVLIVATVAIPIIGGITIPAGTANKAAIESMLGLVPLLLVVAVVVMVVAVAISKYKGN